MLKQQTEQLEPLSTQLTDRLRRSGIPERYWTAHTGYKLPTEKGRGLYFFGRSGRGKTHAACAIARQWLELPIRMVDGRGVYVCDQWRTCRFVVAETLEAQVKSTYGRYGMSEDDLFESLAGVDLLVLDDLGRQRLSAWEASTIYRVINDRYNALRRTVVTSNYSISGLAARIEEQTDTEMAESLASRIAGMCDAVEVKGKDLRLKGNEDR